MCAKLGRSGSRRPARYPEMKSRAAVMELGRYFGNSRTPLGRNKVFSVYDLSAAATIPRRFLPIRGENCRCFHRPVIYFLDGLPTYFVPLSALPMSFFQFLRFRLSLPRSELKRICHISLKAFAQAHVRTSAQAGEHKPGTYNLLASGKKSSQSRTKPAREKQGGERGARERSVSLGDLSSKQTCSSPFPKIYLPRDF